MKYPTKFTIELNKDAARVFEKVLGTGDAQAIANDLHSIILAEFEWNYQYKRVWQGLNNPEWFVYPDE